MSQTLAALRFLAAISVAPASEAPGEALTLTLANGDTVPADRYEPAGRPIGTILFVHGMSPMGRRDPRMCRASRALAAAGFRVITPHIADFQELRIDERTADTVAGCVLAVQARADLSGGRPIGLFSVSYSAGVSFIAASRPAVTSALSAICSLGTFSNLLSWARFMMRDPSCDEYPRLIVFKNLAPAIIGHRPDVLRGLDVALLDNWHQRVAPEFPAFLSTCNAEDRALLAALRTDPEAWGDLGDQLMALHEHDLAGLDVVAIADRVRVPCVLLHGSDDRVIPARESVRLHGALVAAGARSRLVVTPLLGHGDTRFGLRTLPDLVRVIAAFRSFFAQVSAT